MIYKMFTKKTPFCHSVTILRFYTLIAWLLWNFPCVSYIVNARLMNLCMIHIFSTLIYIPCC